MANRLILAARAVEFASVVIMSEDDTAPAPTAVDDHGGRPPWLGPALIAIAALLIGLGGGLAIGSAKSGSDGDHPHGNATAIGFSQDMIVHHGQAVEMTQIVIKRGSDPAVRDLAVTMLTDQNREIGQMTGWLQAWGAPLTNPAAPMSWMGHGSDHCAKWRKWLSMRTAAPMRVAAARSCHSGSSRSRVYDVYSAKSAARRSATSARRSSVLG